MTYEEFLEHLRQVPYRWHVGPMPLTTVARGLPFDMPSILGPFKWIDDITNKLFNGKLFNKKTEHDNLMLVARPGAIYSRKPAEQYPLTCIFEWDPLSAMCLYLTGKPQNLFDWKSSAQAIGLPIKDARRVFKASFCLWGHDPRVRTDILKAVGYTDTDTVAFEAIAAIPNFMGR